MTVLESMNVGLPVVLRKLPIYKEILSDYCLFGDGQEELEELLRQLSEDTEFYTEGCGRSLDGRQYYSRRHVAQMWRAFYNQVIRVREAKRRKKFRLPVNAERAE